MIWKKFVDHSILKAQNLSEKSIISSLDKHGRINYNNYLLINVVKKDTQTALKFIDWPYPILRETAIRFILYDLQKNQAVQMEFTENGGLKRLVEFYVQYTETILPTEREIMNIKTAELLTGCIMNSTQVN